MQIHNAISHQAATLAMVGVLAQVAAETVDAVNGKADEWSEEEIVLLHWRLLRDIGDLDDPSTPLAEKLDTLRWIFTDPDKENRPFSFVSCLSVVGCSPLSPLPYLGQLDPDEIRHAIEIQVKPWLHATLQRYPLWVRNAVLAHPEWVERELTKNPQWINEEVRRCEQQRDFFA